MDDKNRKDNDKKKKKRNKIILDRPKYVTIDDQTGFVAPTTPKMMEALRKDLHNTMKLDLQAKSSDPEVSRKAKECLWAKDIAKKLLKKVRAAKYLGGEES